MTVILSIFRHVTPTLSHGQRRAFAILGPGSAIDSCTREWSHSHAESFGQLTAILH